MIHPGPSRPIPAFGAHKVGLAAVPGAAGGLLFVIASLLSLVRLHQVRWSIGLEATFIVGLAIVLVFQLVEGAKLIAERDVPVR